MSEVKFASSNNLNNHHLKKFVEQTTELLKLSAVQGINSKLNPAVYKLKTSTVNMGVLNTVSVESVASVVANKFGSMSDDLKRAARVSIGRDMKVTKSIRNWAVDMRAESGILDQIDMKKHYGFVNGRNFSSEKMAAMVAEIAPSQAFDSVVSAPEALKNDLVLLDSRFKLLLPNNWIGDIIGNLRDPGNSGGGIVLNKGVNFRVHEVKCIDETNPEWAGHDEIAWGGAAVDDKGGTTKLSEYYVGGGFDDGDKKTYSPPKILHSFQISDSDFPKTFMVTLALAEKDSGGLSKFIDELYNAIKAEITLILTALGAAAGAAIGAGIGGSLGTAIGGPLGTIIGVAAGLILGALIGWLIGALNDDIFEPQASSVIFGSENDTFNGGSLISPLAYFHYRDHGGHYRVKYDWQIVR